MKLRTLLVATALAGAAAAASATDVSISVGGQIAPGVYGRIDIGQGAPAPVVVYPQPVMVAQPTPAAVYMSPIYLNVPPGHAKDWGKHCHKYNACAQRVYFVKTAEYEPGYRTRRGDGDRDKGHGKGHGKGKGKD